MPQTQSLFTFETTVTSAADTGGDHHCHHAPPKGGAGGAGGGPPPRALFTPSGADSGHRNETREERCRRVLSGKPAAHAVLTEPRYFDEHEARRAEQLAQQPSRRPVPQTQPAVASSPQTGIVIGRQSEMDQPLKEPKRSPKCP